MLNLEELHFASVLWWIHDFSFSADVIAYFVKDVMCFVVSTVWNEWIASFCRTKTIQLDYSQSQENSNARTGKRMAPAVLAVSAMKSETSFAWCISLPQLKYSQTVDVVLALPKVFRLTLEVEPNFYQAFSSSV